MENHSENTSFENYLARRANICKTIDKQKYQDLEFSEEEQAVNQIFRKKLNEQRALLPNSFYREYTLKYLNLIESSEIFPLIKKMPKGGVLHIHLDCCFNMSWLFEKCMSPHCYMNLKDHRLCYRKSDPGAEFKQIIKLREKAQDKDKFDEELKNSMQLNQNDVIDEKNTWDIFQEKVLRINQLILFKDHFYDHILCLAKGFLREGVFHLEAREFLNVMTDEEGKLIGIEAEMEIYRKAIIEIRKECPHFTLKIIVQDLKVLGLEEIESNLRDAVFTSKTCPDIIVGYDLVMEEDKYKQMIEIVEVLLKKEKLEKEAGVTLPYVFHGGESLKFLENDNLFDLLLLKTKRIGHGINLAKHSYLMDKFKENNIAIEINPFSNQILDYVYDLRLHPAITYHNYGLKIIINSDDPGIFNTNYINYDFFICAVAMEFDLKDFKKVCQNSIECSLLNPEEKKQAMEIWRKQWDLFIKEIK